MQLTFLSSSVYSSFSIRRFFLSASLTDFLQIQVKLQQIFYTTSIVFSRPKAHCQHYVALYSGSLAEHIAYGEEFVPLDQLCFFFFLQGSLL